MYKQAAKVIKNAERVTAFTGAGISVESGIPSFRGKDGLWSKYNPEFLEIDYFYSNPKRSWELIREIFYDFFGESEPNAAHYALAEMEKNNLLKTVITQNIDNLHTIAGNTNVLEFHGSSRDLICIECSKKYPCIESRLYSLPPKCSCSGILKPDFIFFGEQIPEPAQSLSFAEAELVDVLILIGTTGEVMPAALIPYKAKENGAVIIEVNTRESNYTNDITDIFLIGKATDVMKELQKKLGIG